MRRLDCLASAFLALAVSVIPLPARAQAPGTPASMPLVVDMQKLDVGAWAEYAAKVGDLSLSSRWTLVARDEKSNTVEMMTKGKPIAKPVVLRVVLPADPTSGEKPPRPMVVQLGTDPPMLVPKEMPVPKFQRPDPKNLVGTEEIKVPAGTYKTSHYREKNASGTVDIWVSEAVAPIGVVKAVMTPAVEKDAPAAMQASPYTQELSAVGKGGKPAITKKPQPFDEQKMRGLVGQ